MLEEVLRGVSFTVSWLCLRERGFRIVVLYSLEMLYVLLVIDIILCHWCCLVCSYWWLLIGDWIVAVDLTMLMTNGRTRMEWHQSLVGSVFRVGVWKALLHCIPMLMANGLSRGECHHSMGMTMEPCQPNNSSTCQRAVVFSA